MGRVRTCFEPQPKILGPPTFSTADTGREHGIDDREYAVDPTLFKRTAENAVQKVCFLHTNGTQMTNCYPVL